MAPVRHATFCTVGRCLPINFGVWLGRGCLSSSCCTASRNIHNFLMMTYTRFVLPISSCAFRSPFPFGAFSLWFSLEAVSDTCLCWIAESQRYSSEAWATESKFWVVYCELRGIAYWGVANARARMEETPVTGARKRDRRQAVLNSQLLKEWVFEPCPVFSLISC